MNRGPMGVNSLPKTVTRQRRASAPAIFEPRPFCAWVQHESDFLCITPVWYSTGEQTGLDLLTADRLKMQDWKIVSSSKYSLSCCTYVFHRCIFVLTYSVLAYSILRYFRFPYLRFQSPQFKTITVDCRLQFKKFNLLRRKSYNSNYNTS